MAKVTLSPITTSYAGQAALEAWRTALEAAIENTLSRDGTSPNSMSSDLDMNSNNLLNIDNLSVNTLEIAGQTVVPTTVVPNWEGAWTTATAYVVNDIVRESGSTYICLEAHTSGTFATDLAANKWELFAQQGSAGAGTGDMLAANNLSDVADTDTSLTNLGGGTTGIALFKDATADAARTELGLGSLAVQDTITTADIDDSAVTTAKINDDAVTADKLADTAVTPGSYTNASVTVDQQGRVTAASSGSSGGWQVVERVTGSATSTADLSAYRAIKFNFSCNTGGTSQALSLEARDGAGTWRRLANGLTAAGSSDMYLAWGEISNFNDAAATDRMIAILHTATTTLLMDTTAFDNASTSAETAMGVVFRSGEVWDAMRLVTNAGSLNNMELVIEGLV